MGWLYKVCPRCHGDLYVAREEEELTANCLQCGFERTVPRLRDVASIPQTHFIPEPEVSAA